MSKKVEEKIETKALDCTHPGCGLPATKLMELDGRDYPYCDKHGSDAATVGFTFAERI